MLWAIKENKYLLGTYVESERNLLGTYVKNYRTFSEDILKIHDERRFHCNYKTEING
jgi:hypothetical protein